jgi:hypothetical protein
MRARRESDLERMRIEMAAAQEEFVRAVEQGAEPLRAAMKYRDKFGSWPKPRGRRKPGGGEFAPVRPRPKPTPLVDGAEAPID